MKDGDGLALALALTDGDCEELRVTLLVCVRDGRQLACTASSSTPGNAPSGTVGHTLLTLDTSSADAAPYVPIGAAVGSTPATKCQRIAPAPAPVTRSEKLKDVAYAATEKDDGRAKVT